MKVVEGKGEQNLFLGGLDSRLGLLSGGFEKGFSVGVGDSVEGDWQREV